MDKPYVLLSNTRGGRKKQRIDNIYAILLQPGTPGYSANNRVGWSPCIAIYRRGSASYLHYDNYKAAKADYKKLKGVMHE